MEFGQWENAEPGVKRRIYAPGKQLMMMEVHFEPGAEGYLHSHPHEQMSYCMKGSLEFCIDDQVIILRQGEVLSIPGDAKHGVKALEAAILLDCFTPLREDLLSRMK